MLRPRLHKKLVHVLIKNQRDKGNTFSVYNDSSLTETSWFKIDLFTTNLWRSQVLSLGHVPIFLFISCLYKHRYKTVAVFQVKSQFFLAVFPDVLLGDDVGRAADQDCRPAGQTFLLQKHSCINNSWLLPSSDTWHSTLLQLLYFHFPFTLNGTVFPLVQPDHVPRRLLNTLYFGPMTKSSSTCVFIAFH